MQEQIKQFFSSDAYAVVGASNNRAKYGNKVLRCYLQNDLVVYPINPKEEVVEGINCVAKIANLPKNVRSISIITPPAITEKVVDEAIKFGIKNIWMQPGAESEKAIQQCLKKHINVIAKGPCILVALGYKE